MKKTITLFVVLGLFAKFAAAQYVCIPPATRIWTGGGDGHTWNDAFNWNSTCCDQATPNFTVPQTGEIVEFINVGNLTVDGCPGLQLGNVNYNAGYNHCVGTITSNLTLYSLQILDNSYVTLNGGGMTAGGIIAAGNGVTEALRVINARLSCIGIYGNYASGFVGVLNMPSIYAENSIIDCGISGTFQPSGRSKFINCTINAGNFFPNSDGDFVNEKDEFYSCTMNVGRVYFYGKCNAEIYNSTFNITGDQFSLNSMNEPNKVLLDSVQINVSANSPSLFITYMQGASEIKGNIRCNNTSPSFMLTFQNGTNIKSYPLLVDGDITLLGGSFFVQSQGLLNITGNLELNGTPNPDYTKAVMVNSQSAFQIGGIDNFADYNSPGSDFLPGANFRHYSIKFSGDKDSHVKWPLGFPADTLIIEKTACGKVYFDNAPLHVTGKLQVNSGQLNVGAQTGSNYGLVNGNDLVIRNGGSIKVLPNSDVALASNFIDSNTVINASTCNGFANTNGKIFIYTNPFTSATPVIGTASNTSIGDVQFITQNNVPYTLQNNFATNNFDFGSNGKIILGNYNFTVNGALVNSTASKFFVTNGSGKLNLKNISTTSITFPIGPDPTTFTPVIISNSGTVDDFSARVQQGVYSNGLTGTQANSNAVNLTWLIDETNTGGSNATVTTQWDTSDELPGFIRNNAYLSHYNNGSWNFGPLLTTTGSGPYTVTRTNLNSFSPFVVTNPNSVLPIVLNFFRGIKRGSSVELSWQTAQEQNASHFNLQRSLKGINFSTIGRITAAAFSTLIKDYNYTDSNIVSLNLSNVYYRLEQVDKNGKKEYSNIVAISLFETKNFFTISPNPAKDKLQLSFSPSWLSSNTMLSIIDASGKIIIRKIIKSSTLDIDIRNLSKGFFLITLNNNKESISKPFLKD